MDIDKLEQMLANGQDNFLLRFGLGSALLKHKSYARALPHLRQAVTFDPQHSAAWKLLGKTLAACEQYEEAKAAYTRGIAVAEQRGDIQAAREMQVFLQRLTPP